jgi:hypothetical protein
MVRQTFTIRVEVLNCKESDTAIATASSYLTYVDLTNTVGYAPDFRDVEVHEISSGPIGVTFEVSVQVQDDDHLKEIMDQFADITRVESVERESNAVLP